MSFGTGPFGVTPFGTAGGSEGGSASIATAYPVQMFIPGQGLPTVLATGTSVTSSERALIEMLADKAGVGIVDYVGIVEDPFGDAIPATRGWVTQQIRDMIQSGDFTLQGTWNFQVRPKVGGTPI